MGESEKPEEAPAAKGDEKPVYADRPEQTATSKDTVVVDGQTLSYTATVSTINLRDKRDDDEASLFSVAYILDGVEDPATRPVTFCFNGGPGSSSVWLHLGVFGPRRVEVPDLAAAPPAPHRLIDNAHSLLDRTDLVFIDPVGTGFSRPQGKSEGKEFHGLEEDAESVSRFIERWITRNHRWASPRFLAGESYGTTRSAALAGKLQKRGVSFNGLVLISVALDFKTIVFEGGNDLPYILYLPTYAAAAWYHDRLANRPDDLETLLADVRRFAFDVYAPALLRGSSLGEDERRQVAEQLSAYTGIDVEEIVRRELRIHYLWFAKNLLGSGPETLGRMDARFVGLDDGVDEYMSNDPSIDAPFAAFTSAANDYLRRILGWEGDDSYEILNLDVNRAWKWNIDQKMGYPEAMVDLRKAMVSNPHLRVLMVNGVFDLATPFFAAEYTADHLGLPPELRQRVELAYYGAGHMMYFHPPSLDQLRADLTRWYDEATGKQ